MEHARDDIQCDPRPPPPPQSLEGIATKGYSHKGLTFRLPRMETTARRQEQRLPTVPEGEFNISEQDLQQAEQRIA